ncbi:hypothetical protein [Leifsonia aquatica]|uniref:hypothetical protein n=1 Tax=Leifsonia aquatica TaxID=144185 RepID=UPI000468B234|nr:hypothetical protein [Leifsonia aquatica]
MANSGTFPLDKATDVGRVRLVLGDTEATGVVDGKGDYAYWSDDSIDVALVLEDGNILRACAVLVEQLAVALTVAGQSIKADDFSINTLGKGGDLLDAAARYQARADVAEARAGREEAGSFAVVSTTTIHHPQHLGIESWGSL